MRAGLPAQSPSRVVRSTACEYADGFGRVATLEFAHFAESANEFRQVRRQCQSLDRRTWSCDPAQASRHVFTRLRSRSVVVDETIPLADALTVIAFGESHALWRRHRPYCPALTRDGDVFVLRELEVELGIVLKHGTPRVVRAERWIL